MNSIYTSMAALMFQETGVLMINSDQRSNLLSIHDYHLPSVLEMFIHHNSVENAYQAYRSFRQSKSFIDITISDSIRRAFGTRPNRIATLMIRNKVLVCPAEELFSAYQFATKVSGLGAVQHKLVAEMIKRRHRLDLTAQSLGAPLVLSTLHACCLSTNIDYPDLTLDQFTATVKRLFASGYLTAPVGAVDFGDLNRFVPFCHEFGYSRGTPIDRYYLNKFIEEIRDEVTGDALEIGGTKQNQRLYGFSQTKTYRTLDVSSNTDVDIVGDAHDPNICANNSLDSIIIFNVLEHCEKPWVVVDNIYNWLREGGKVFCMVPTAQRIHGSPNDFWRILPDAMGSLFSRFSEVKVLSYGNPITTITSVMGIAAEELSSEELESFNKEYPVATCVFAKKA